MAKYRVVLRHSEEGYSVSCPDLPGCWSQGATEEEALQNIRIAIQEYVEEDISFSEIHGNPSESPSTVKKLEFTCTETLNVWGGIDLMPQLLRAMEIRDPDVYARMQAFYSALNHDGILNERCSSQILLDLFFGTEIFGVRPFTVIDEIKSLEKLKISQTKQAEQFTRPTLGGLWHKHYMNGDVASLAQNIKNALNEYGIPFFEEKIREAQAAGEKRFVTKDDVPKIVNDVVTNNRARRRSEGKITGEWIVYAQHEDQNFYLCLAKHNDGDEKIRERIERICVREFPFLKNIFLPAVINPTG
jgi:predicted RNase H-like HicB family nuclease